MTRALSFGAAAGRYERFRPGYSDALVDAVLAHARHPVRTALEIGAGTGKATRIFAVRGIAVTATDPDEAMLQELREHVPTEVVTVKAAFEDLPLDHTYDLVLAANSMHWTDPADRWVRVATLLESGGVFASVGGPLYLADAELAAIVHTASAPFLAAQDIPAPDGASTNLDMRWPGTELEQTPWFTAVQQSVIARRFTLPATDYIGLLSTISAYLVLPDPLRVKIFDAILRELPAQVDVIADATLHMAKRNDVPLPRWVVWRQDDHGNQFEVARHVLRTDAENQAAALEARGHKQTYWVAEA